MKDTVTVLRNGLLAGHARVQDVSVDWVIKQMTGRKSS